MKKVDFKTAIKTWYSVYLKKECTELDVLSLEALLNMQIRCPGGENCNNLGDCGNCIRHPRIEDNYTIKIALGNKID
jgi:hypothetical protein